MTEDNFQNIESGLTGRLQFQHVTAISGIRRHAEIAASPELNPL